MTLKALGLAALSATIACAFAGDAGAASTKRHHASVHSKSHMSSTHRHYMARTFPQQRTFSVNGIGHYVLAPGDSRARVNASYPVDANPPSLTQTYNYRGRKMQEMRN
jgi:hypothetical protein